MRFRIIPLTILLAAAVEAGAAESNWPKLTLSNPDGVEMNGSTGAAFRRGVERLAQAPYSVDWVLADVSFGVNRIFTNYSGDVSGRFLELAALTSPSGHTSPATLAPVMDAIAKYQKPDGHFGADMDFAEPMKRLSPPIPMLWGNARLLVGLITAARECNQPALLKSARRLGDFYVETYAMFHAREAELLATGTGGDGFACCYFPAMEGLAMLYQATNDRRYLEQGRRMAEWFKKFDKLPVDHSHGNLCAWRGILDLYNITGEKEYLDRALAKWAQAVDGGYVWTLGGVGEHWYINHSGDEGCSESDWLRFNLDLWRYTGQNRYLDMAERLLLNQYPANQCPNGGYGWRHFDGDAAGPVGTRGPVAEWDFCCSFHGPLGLHFLKSYLVASSSRGIFINIPADFSARVPAPQGPWQISMRSLPGSAGQQEFEIEAAPADSPSAVRTTLWLRKPDWAVRASLAGPGGAAIACSEEQGCVKVEREFKRGEKLRLTLGSALRIEQRRFAPGKPDPTKISRWRDVSLLFGPDVLFATPARAGRVTLLARLDPAGQPRFWQLPDGTTITVTLPGPDADEAQIAAALETARPLRLCPESGLKSPRRAPFMHDLVVVPESALSAQAVARFSARAPEALRQALGPFYGKNLEQQPDCWLAGPEWRFSTNGLHVTSGDVGLLDGEGYADYRFEFDLELPAAGQGIAGWIIRARDPCNCLHFQIQSADSPYNAPEFKTRPNTLRPHTRRNGHWAITEPVVLPKPVRRGETHRIAVECRGPKVAVFLDGENIYQADHAAYPSGSVGFRSGSAAEQGLFRNISLQKL